MSANYYPIYAENRDKTPVSHQKTYEFDLESSYQSIQFYDSEGYLTTITVTRSRSLVGERNVFVSNAQLQLSFTILIQNDVIIDAYNQHYHASTWIVTGDSLVVNSGSQATYTVQCHQLMLYFSKYAQANISNGKLSISSNL